MNPFLDVLAQVKTRSPELFHEAALRPPDDDEPVIEVDEIVIPGQRGIKDRTGAQRPPNVFDDEIIHEEQIWSNLPRDDDEDFERDSPRSNEEKSHYPSSVTRVGIELLAVYLPFHFYPAGSWGIRFFEKPMERFVSMLESLLRRRGFVYSWDEVLRLTTYAVARHEFTHYLVELEALDLELKQGRSIYLPYQRGVYAPNYPGMDCLEETVASFWSWDNETIRSPADLRETVRNTIRMLHGTAYAAGGYLDREKIRPVEDALAAQLRQTVARPASPPPVWGALPRPYVQPWTRYENVSFTMNRSAGGKLAGWLGPKQPRKTIRIYHR